MNGAASFSACGGYRYRLARWWDETIRLVDDDRDEWPGDGFRPLVFIMLNPSRADAVRNDATIRRCVGFAIREGCNGIAVGNLYPIVTPYPHELRSRVEATPWEIREINRYTIDALVAHARDAGTRVIAAWGASPRGIENHRHAISAVTDIAEAYGIDLWCLGRTADNAPRHPLRLRNDTPLEIWRAFAPDMEERPRS